MILEPKDVLKEFVRMIYKAIISGHIWVEDNGEKHAEILSQVDNDKEYTEIFDDLEHALVDNIDIGNSNDYYFIAVVESQFVKDKYWDCTEYDVEHEIIEIKNLEDIKL